MQTVACASATTMEDLFSPMYSPSSKSAASVPVAGGGGGSMAASFILENASATVQKAAYNLP